MFRNPLQLKGRFQSLIGSNDVLSPHCKQDHTDLELLLKLRCGSLKKATHFTLIYREGTLYGP